jgi:hypothetical protein
VVQGMAPCALLSLVELTPDSAEIRLPDDAEVGGTDLGNFGDGSKGDVDVVVDLVVDSIIDLVVGDEDVRVVWAEDVALPEVKDGTRGGIDLAFFRRLSKKRLRADMLN